MTCDPQSLLDAARCFSCIPAGMLASVGTNLFCQLTNQPITPVKPFVPTDIPCLVDWYRLEDIDNGKFLDGDPIDVWPPFFGPDDLLPYDPSGTGIVPLYEAAPAGPGPTMGDANLAGGGAFVLQRHLYPLEVFMVGWTLESVLGTVRATLVNGPGLPLPADPFRYYIDPADTFFKMDLGVVSASNILAPPYYSHWTTYDCCMAAANSHVEVGPTVGTLAPLNPGTHQDDAYIVIGNDWTFDGTNFDQLRWGGSVAEILFFDCVLTNQQRQDLRTYFKIKYPVTPGFGVV